MKQSQLTLEIEIKSSLVINWQRQNEMQLTDSVNSGGHIGGLPS